MVSINLHTKVSANAMFTSSDFVHEFVCACEFVLASSNFLSRLARLLFLSFFFFFFVCVCVPVFVLFVF